MKIFLAQQNYHIGNLEYNRNKIVEAIHQAIRAGADLLVFSELAICGYPPKDLLLSKAFIEACLESISIIAVECKNIAVLIGAPIPNQDQSGKPLHNAALLIEDGKVSYVIKKTCLPTYDVFDEDRYFEPAKEWNCITVKNKRIAVTVCEDLWNFGDQKRYTNDPMSHLMSQRPELIINLSASPYDYRHCAERMEMLRYHATKHQIPIIYCNAVGAQTDLIFDGASMCMNAAGKIQSLHPAFEEGVFDSKWNEAPDYADEKVQQKVDANIFQSELDIASIHQALIMGIRDYFSKMGFRKAILGSSGGIDSAVVLALAVEALGAENVMAVLMPSKYSSEHSVEDAVQLSKRLGNPYEIVPLHASHVALEETLKPFFSQRPPGLAEENLQSRLRGNLLMSIANKLDFILLNTSNKSELATGYGTLYGDMAGGLSVIGDCYKTQVYALAKYLNKEDEIIPNNIIEKAPSAELRPDQKDMDSLPEYDLLDSVLYLYIDRLLDEKEIVSMGYDESLVKRVITMVDRNEYKRYQFCPILRVSSKAFGSGRRIPIVSKFVSG
jgi:NAD+ synthase (glutamine-hydrolysing)